MSAAIVPFPIARRHKFIERQANRVAGMARDAGERHIQTLRKVQTDVLRRKGVGDEMIARELQHMENAIRNALWCGVL